MSTQKPVKEKLIEEFWIIFFLNCGYLKPSFDILTNSEIFTKIDFWHISKWCNNLYLI